MRTVTSPAERWPGGQFSWFRQQSLDFITGSPIKSHVPLGVEHIGMELMSHVGSCNGMSLVYPSGEVRIATQRTDGSVVIFKVGLQFLLQNKCIKK